MGAGSSKFGAKGAIILLPATATGPVLAQLPVLCHLDKMDTEEETALYNVLSHFRTAISPGCWFISYQPCWIVLMRLGVLETLQAYLYILGWFHSALQNRSYVTKPD